MQFLIDHRSMMMTDTDTDVDLQYLLMGSTDHPPPPSSSMDLASELQNQSFEIDCFLHFQERLRAILDEETRRTETMLMHRYESRMNQRDEALANVTCRRKELHNCFLKAQKEAEEWEQRARENEAVVLDLNAKLQLVVHQLASRDRCQLYPGGAAQDAESSCDVIGKGWGGGGGCRVCHVRSSCVLFLPCRHMCCCSACDALIRTCPVCRTVKDASVEVFFA